MALSEVPFLSAALNELRAGRARRILDQRLERLALELTEKLERVEDAAVNKDFLESDAFYDLLLSAVETAGRTRDRTKHERVAQVLRGAIVQGDPEDGSPEEHLAVISGLTPLELSVAREIYDLARNEDEGISDEGAESPWLAWVSEMCNRLHIERADLQAALGRLRSAGLLVESIGSVRITASPSDIPQYVVSDYFTRLMTFLEQEGKR